MSELSKLSDEALLARAHRLALESLVEQLEDGEYISSGNLSYLNTLSKNSNIKPITEESNDIDINEKIQSLIGTANKAKHKQHSVVDMPRPSAPKRRLSDDI